MLQGQAGAERVRPYGCRAHLAGSGLSQRKLFTFRSFFRFFLCGKGSLFGQTEKSVGSSSSLLLLIVIPSKSSYRSSNFELYSRIIIVSWGRGILTEGPAWSVPWERFLGLAGVWRKGWAYLSLNCTYSFSININVLSPSDLVVLHRANYCWYRPSGDDIVVGRSCRVGILISSLRTVRLWFDYGQMRWRFCVRIMIHIILSSFENRLVRQFITTS